MTVLIERVAVSYIGIEKRPITFGVDIIVKRRPRQRIIAFFLGMVFNHPLQSGQIGIITTRLFLHPQSGGDQPGRDAGIIDRVRCRQSLGIDIGIPDQFRHADPIERIANLAPGQRQLGNRSRLGIEIDQININRLGGKSLIESLRV